MTSADLKLWLKNAADSARAMTKVIRSFISRDAEITLKLLTIYRETHDTYYKVQEAAENLSAQSGYAWMFISEAVDFVAGGEVERLDLNLKLREWASAHAIKLNSSLRWHIDKFLAAKGGQLNTEIIPFRWRGITLKRDTSFSEALSPIDLSDSS
jgi:hypothetical protein